MITVTVTVTVTVTGAGIAIGGNANGNLITYLAWVSTYEAPAQGTERPPATA